MFEVGAYKQESHYKYLCHWRMYFENQYEDTKLNFLDVSYDEEAEELIDHNQKWHYNLLMKNTSNSADYPVKDKHTFKIRIRHLH